MNSIVYDFAFFKQVASKAPAILESYLPPYDGPKFDTDR